MERKRKERQRQTRTVSRPAPRKREEGRPRGTLKRFPFEQTRLGFMLRYEMPVVYFLLRRLCPAQPFEPDWRVVEAVARSAADTSRDKPKFRRYLQEYARDGVYCRRGKLLTPERKAYYEHIRSVKMKEYIRRNRKRLQMSGTGGESPEKRLNELKSILKNII